MEVYLKKLKKKRKNVLENWLLKCSKLWKTICLKMAKELSSKLEKIIVQINQLPLIENGVSVLSNIEIIRIQIIL